MIGSLSALKASRISPTTTARLTAPTTTGLRSRKGMLISGSPRRCSAEERSGGDEERRGVSSLQAAPIRSDLVVDGHGGRADPDLTGEVAEVEVEPRAVGGGAADLGQLDRHHLEGAVDLGLATVEVGGEAAQVVDVGDERGADPGDQVGGLGGELRDLVQRPEDRPTVVPEAADEVLEGGDQLVQLLVALADVVEHGVQIGDQAADHLVATGQG